MLQDLEVILKLLTCCCFEDCSVKDTEKECREYREIEN